MMTARKIDKIMKNVMLMYQAEAVKEFASYSDTPVEFSPEFENNIKMLSARNRGKIVRVDRRRRIAKVAIAITIAFTMLTAFAARDKIIDFFINVFEINTRFTLNDEGRVEILVKYNMQYIPNSYILDQNYDTPNIRFQLWRYGNKTIYYTQSLSVSSNIYVDDINGSYVKKSVDDITYII